MVMTITMSPLILNFLFLPWNRRSALTHLQSIKSRLGNQQPISSKVDFTKNIGNHNELKNCSILRPLVVCGPSGVGKGTIISKYMEERGGSNDFGFAVSHTTRKARPGEIDGIHYYFADYYSMKDAIDRDEFLEHADVHGNLYGTSFESLRHVEDTKAKIPILDIDVQGVKNIKAKVNDGFVALQPKYIFIAPPSLNILRERLISRGTETEESVEKRSKNALMEMEYGMAKGNFDEIVVNNDLNQAVDDFVAAVIKLYKE